MTIFDATSGASTLTTLTDEDAGVVNVNLLQGASAPEGTVLAVSDFTQTSGPATVYAVTDGILSVDTGQFAALREGETATLSFSYLVDAGTEQAPQSVTLTLAGHNDAPTLTSAVIATTDEDADTFFLNLLAGAADVDSASLSVTGLTLLSGQEVSYTVDHGVLSLDPSQFNALAQGQNEVLQFSYAITDGEGGTVTQTAQITVEGRNDSPLAEDSAVLAAIDEDTVAPAGATVASLFTSKFSDADRGGHLAGIAIIGNTVGSGAGSWQFSTNGGTTWLDVGLISADTGLMLSASALLRFVPSANYNGTPPSLDVLLVDDSYGGAWSNGGTRATGSLPDLRPNVGHCGTSALTDLVTHLNTNVNAVNDAPVVVIPAMNADAIGPELLASKTFTEGGESARVFQGLQLSDVDNTTLTWASVAITNRAAGDVLNFTPQSGITGYYDSGTGILMLTGTASIAAYQAALDSVVFSNTSNNPSTTNRTVSLTVNDGSATSAAITQTVQVVAIDDAPTLTVSNIANGLKENLTALTLATVVATDRNHGTITFSVSDDRFEVASGVLRLKAGVSLDYEAVSGGTGSVTVTATDALGASTSQVVTYQIVNVDEALVANFDSVATTEDKAVTIDILGNDQHASNVRLPTITSVSAPNGGTVTINADGTLTYMPGANRSGSPYVSYTLAENGKTSTGWVRVLITAQADAPLVSLAPASGDVYAAVPLNLSAALTDLDGSETLSITIKGLPSQATLSAGTRDSYGDWTVPASQLAGLTVTGGRAGTYALTVSATSVEQSNGSSTSTTTATGTLTITGNAAPTLSAFNILTAVQENYTVDLATVTAADPEGGAVTFTVSDDRFEVVNGILSLKRGMSLDYEADSSHAGSVTVTATDALGASTSRTVAYTITNIQEPAFAIDDEVNITEDTSIIINVLENDIYANVTRPPSIIEAWASHGSVTINADHTLTYTPEANCSDSAVIDYTLLEDGLASIGRVYVEIEPQADAPTVEVTVGTDASVGTIPLNLTVALTDTDGSEYLSNIVVSGLPADAWLSAGSRQSNGDWILFEDDLPNLAIDTGQGKNFQLKVTATAVESQNGNTSSRSVTKTLIFNADSTIQGDWLFGTAGADTISGQPGADYMDGCGGNDVLKGEAGNDYLKGGAGNDTLWGEGGNDTLYGGDGNDILAGDSLSGQNGSNSLYGEAGNDYLYTLYGTRSFVDGGTGDDTFVIGSGNATIIGGQGRDTMRFIENYPYDMGASNIIMDFTAGTGGDILDLSEYLADFELGGWNGRSNLFAQGFVRLVDSNGATLVQIDRDGGKTIRQWTTICTLADTQASSLTADNFAQLMNFDPSGVLPAGSTITSTSTGTETLTGSGGDDTLTGGTGRSSLLGGAGNDVLSGGAGDDTLVGGSGDDTLVGGAGNDVLFGGTAVFTGFGNEMIDGGDGNDAISVGYGRSIIYGGSGNDTISVVAESLYGNSTIDMGDGDDVVALNASGATVTSGAGRDLIQAGYSVNSSAVNVVTDFSAGLGGDRIDLKYLWGLPGNPFGAAGFLRLRQEGADTIIEMDGDGAAKAAYGFKPILILKNVEASTLTRDNFTPAYDPSGAEPTGLSLTGSSGNDTLLGSGGDDYLAGGNGADNLTGGNGDDFLHGEAGDDCLDGGTGNDVIDGGDGDDYLQDDCGDDWLYGGAGNDVLSSAIGRNHLFGGDGNDRISLFSNVGDVVDGGNGNDTIFTNYNGGTDTVTTGAGQDKVVIMSMTSAVTSVIVTDFTAGAGGDLIDLSSLQQTYLKGWNGSANPFGAGFLRVVQVGNDAVLQIDPDALGGSAPWQSLAVFVGVDASKLTSGNFFPAFSPDGSGILGISQNGSSGADAMAGTYGDDTLFGSGGNDTFSGGDGSDKIDGGDGSDTLSGGMGNDSLSGGAGQDFYLFDYGYGIDTIVNAQNNVDGAADTLRFGAGITAGALWFVRNGTDLEISLLGGPDKVVLAGWYGGDATAKVQTIQLADGTALGQSNVENLVSAMAVFAPPSATQTQLTAQQHQSLDGIIAANWQHA